MDHRIVDGSVDRSLCRSGDPMNKSRQNEIKAICASTFPVVAKRFESVEKYERFVRRFYNQRGRYPRLTEIGNGGYVSPHIRRQGWDKELGFKLPSLATMMQKQRRRNRAKAKARAESIPVTGGER